MVKMLSFHLPLGTSLRYDASSYTYFSQISILETFINIKKIFQVILNAPFKNIFLNPMQYSNAIFLLLQYKSWFYTLELCLVRPMFI